MNLTTKNASSADAALTFNVNSTTGISAVGLTFSTQIAGLAVTSVTESVYTSLGGTLVGYADVSCSTNPCNVATLSDNISLGGSYTSLYIIKDISLAGYATGDYSTTSFVQQTYTTATPEPVTMSLIGGGLAVLGLIRLRKKA